MRHRSSSSAVNQPCLDPQSTCCQELGGAEQVFFFCGQPALLRPPVHMLPGIGWCGTGLPPFPTACWWLTHPAATTGVSVSARWDSPGGCGGLFCFFAIAECRVHDANLLQVCSQATVSCSQPEYSGLLMSCQTVDWVCRGVVVSSGPSQLAFLTVSEQGFGFLARWRWTGAAVFAPRLGQVICACRTEGQSTADQPQKKNDSSIGNLTSN